MRELQIKYKDGLRFHLYRPTRIRVGIIGYYVRTPYIKLLPYGTLTIKKGYAWDGPSGPCKFIADHLLPFLRMAYLKTILPGSLVHDALYQLLRMQLLPQECRPVADQVFKDINLQCGMSRLRAWWTYQAVKHAGQSSADPKNKRHVLTAP